jgi:hypothetical protein
VPVPAGGGSSAATEAWAPSLDQVADHVPGRTLAQDLSGALLTFDDTTRPAGDEVDRLIAEACNWITVKVGFTIHSTLQEFAGDTAAVYAAAMVERGYPTRADDLSTADSLYKQAVDMRNDLATANLALTGADPVNPADLVMPTWSFPTPERWGDVLL